MTRNPQRGMSRQRLRLARGILGMLFALGFGAERAAARAVDPPPERPERSLPDYLEMKAASDAFRGVADDFIARAAAGDTDALMGMISPHMVDYAGRKVVAGILERDVLPFFKPLRAVVPNVTITETTDGFGSHGFAYYMYAAMTTPRQAPRPFVIYLVREGGSIVVANILVDQFVDGRHAPLG